MLELQRILVCCASASVPSIDALQPVHIATWIGAATRELAAPNVEQRLAAIRHRSTSSSARAPNYPLAIGQSRQGRDSG